MVKPCQLFLVILLTFSVILSFASFVRAQNIVYTVDHEWAQIFINQDGTIDLSYNITLTVTSGTIRSFDVGQPNQDFTIGAAMDQFGNQLHKYKYTPDVASVDLKQPLNAGESIWYMITTNVAHMIYVDTTNPGNDGMEFAPQWLSIPINDVRVQIIMPQGVSISDVKTLPDKPWNSTSSVDGKTAVFWQIPTLQPSQQYLIGVSFPGQALPSYTPIPTPTATTSDGGSIGANWTSFLPLIFLPIFFVVLIAVIITAARKSSYASPQIGIETLGIKRGLTAVEASYLLDFKPPQIVTEILYSLLQKRAVWATETKPSLRLKVLAPYDNKTGTQENPLRYYEIDFLNSLRADGSLDEEKLAKTIMFLRETVEQKMQGFSHKDTIDYYRRITSQAWTQVEQAGTPELASNAYDQQLLWLMLDPNQRTRTETVFHDRVFQPNPLWFWWWYGYTIYYPHPTVQPNIDVPAQSGKPPAIPGADFANNIATSVEKTSNNIVVNLEKFANSIVPPPPKASHEPAHPKASCVCACAACACACACVSCACACAGGGAR